MIYCRCGHFAAEHFAAQSACQADGCPCERFVERTPVTCQTAEVAAAIDAVVRMLAPLNESVQRTVLHRASVLLNAHGCSEEVR